MNMILFKNINYDEFMIKNCIYPLSVFFMYAFSSLSLLISMMLHSKIILDKRMDACAVCLAKYHV